MKIAILLSTYNGERFLEEQLETIAHQTLSDKVHLYIRDDNSSDDTLNIIEKFKKVINITLCKGENIGPAKSFWSLFQDRAIKADYYAFADQDDLWDYCKIERAVSKLIDYNEIPALYCSNCRIIDSKNNILERNMNKENPEFTIISQIICGSTQGCAMVFNDALRNYILRKPVKNFPMHDYVIMTYAIAAGTVIYDDKPSFSYRVHENNVVANRGKGFIKSFKNRLSNWFSDKHKYEISKFAETIYCDNKELLDDDTKNYLECMMRTRYSLLARIKIITDYRTTSLNHRAENSFKIRTLIGII